MFMALVFLVMILAGTFIIMSLNSQQEDHQAAELALQAGGVRTSVFDSAISQAGPDTVIGSNEFEELFHQPFAIMVAERLPIGMEAFIISGSTRLTIEASPGAAGFYDSLTSQVVISALNGQQSFAARSNYPNHLGQNIRWYELAVPIFLSESDFPDYVIYVRSNAEDFIELLDTITATIALAALLALFGASVLSIIFAGSLTQNLLHLNKRINEFKVGMAAEPIAVEIIKDEIGQLAQSFGNMSKELNDGMAAITNEKNKMEIIMYNMSDGILAYDEAGVLLHSNHACEELLGISSIGDLSMGELFFKVGIDFIPGQSLESMQDTIINIEEKYVNVGFNPYKDDIGNTKGSIIVFQDITKHMLLDNMRKEFVANVSHEIRTPLTTIKSYAETLIDGAGEIPDLRNEFLSVINNEADRMAQIIKDLLELSRFDSKRMDIEFKYTDLVAIVKGNASQHKLYSEKNNKEINFTTELSSAHIYMDPARINQVLNNIITNSLRYSDDGAKVNVEITESGHHYMVYINDNGIGIPKEDLRSVFERFYRVDKARSRELGGTGLGLSIAKEIMEAHGGRINVSSELGVGTTMMLRFPKDRRSIERLDDEV